jgi:hypothetical protein
VVRAPGRAGSALLTSISALAIGAAHATVWTGGEMGCVAQGFLMVVMLAGEAKEHLLLLVIRRAANAEHS